MRACGREGGKGRYLPIFVAIPRAVSSVSPSMISIASVKIFSGFEAATSSMLVPPTGLATITGPCVLLSIMIDKYISRRMYSLSTSST